MDALVKNLRAVLKPEQIISEAEELLVYECDGLTHYRHRPRAVVFPATTEEASEVLRLLARERVAVVARGAGTGLSGGALAVGGGVCVELARMRKILKVDVENRLAVVEAGVVNAQVSRAVASRGLHYVPDPSSQGSCTVGGNAAENAGGIHCLKYGTTTDHVLGARVVLYGGRVVDLGGFGAGTSGYDLLGVFVGSEGTFGIATELTVRLTPVAPSVRTLLADFSDIDDASRAVSAIIAAGMIPAALEMVDGETIRAVEASVFAAGMPTDAAGALLVELDGLEAGIDEDVARVRQICEANGARSVRLAADESERKKLWAARKGAFGAMGRITPDVLIQDAVVPRSRLPEVLAATYRIGERYSLRVANVFHAGDGNLHPLVCFDARDPDQVRRVKEAGREIMETCVRAGGTITGEHGVGLDKSDYLPLVFSDDDMHAMLEVRAAFDPTGLCNPGKIIPAHRGCGEARAVAESKQASRVGYDGAAAVKDENDTSASEAEGRVTKGAAQKSETASVSSSPSAPAPSHSTETRRTAVISRAAFDAERAVTALAGVVGEERLKIDVRDGGGRDSSPSVVAEPASVEEVCEVLKLAAREGWGVVPAGAGGWLDAGDPLTRACVVVKTTRMRRPIEHEPADLVASASAGVSLAEFNREVGRAGQWLPLDPPGARAATLGGVAATGAAGAQTLGYGPPRSYVLGMSVALADGRVVRAGSRVVKNVAGYDLCKLFVGSHGTLGLITELTFKLRPRPEREATLIARAGDLEALLSAARAVVAAQLLPTAVELLSPRVASSLGLTGDEDSHALLARFSGTRGAVEHQIARAGELVREHAAGAVVESVSDDESIWEGLSEFGLRAGHSLALRACVLPSSLGTALSRLRDEAGGSNELAWHAGAGDGRVRASVFGGAGEEQVLGSLRRMRDYARGAGGSLVVERAPASLKRAVGAWGLTDSAEFLMRRVKRRLDPDELFSPGRFAQNRDE